MRALYSQKPSVEEWLSQAEVVIDRLSDCIRVYKKPPYDAFISESERQHKIDGCVKLLHRLHALVDRSETPTDSVADVHWHDEKTVGGLSILFQEALVFLPQLSADMQKLLKSAWMGKFSNRTAEIIFAGNGDEDKGIGSGYPEQGRLPAILASMLDQEGTGETRHPREDLLRHGEPRRHDVEGRARWTEQNSRFLRSAGRVE